MDRRNFWDWFLGREQKEIFDKKEFERQRADNPLIKQLEKDRANRERTRKEMVIIGNLTVDCMKLVSKYGNDIPREDYAFYFLHDGWSSFLPISIRPFLKPWESGPGFVGSLTAHID